MAIVKIINRKTAKTYAVKAILDYIRNPAKTENGLLCSAKDCLLECAYQQMINTKLDFQQDTGRQYIHIVQSFAADDKLNSKIAHEIGQRLLESFDGFQGVVCTHTDRNQLHSHIVLNSVNWKTGRKWQFSKNDLYRLRELSDSLCREYGLSVIDKSKGWQQSGKYRTKGASWKQMLAQDVAACLEKSANRQDFLHNLDVLGLDADFGRKNIMFFVRKNAAGRYGLKKEMRCENKKLMSYGDFSKENIENTLQVNNNLVNQGWKNFDVLQDVLLELGRIHFPDDYTRLQDMHFNNISFDGLTRQEIEILLKQREQERLSQKARLEYEQQLNRKNMVLPCIAGILEEVLQWKEQSITDSCIGWTYEDEEEFEI